MDGTFAHRSSQVGIDVLEEIEQRVLWLAIRMVDYANRGDGGGIKIGGHQASSASMVSIMTALWFGHIGTEDKVAVKPHASPVYHAIKYLTGELDVSYLMRFRQKGGLQAYPSRTKDPDVADFSTGSVGLGAIAPLFSAGARRYVDSHFGPRPPARFVGIAGDAELDEGSIWEAIAEPALQGLGKVMLIVDLNRQSLDRVIPGIEARRLKSFFRDAGWHVVEAKYGRELEALFARPGGDVLRTYIDEMSNEEYQSLFEVEGAELRERFCANADRAVEDLLAGLSNEELGRTLRNLGGHDLGLLLDCYRRCDAEPKRPSVVFAYTIKGWGLPFAGDPMNHAALLSTAQIDEHRQKLGLSLQSEWDRFDPKSAAGRLCEMVGAEINNTPPPPRPRLGVPSSTIQSRQARPISTQEAFGRILVALANESEVADRLVTCSPDVSVSTNLGGWINKMGVYAPEESPDLLGEGGLLRWKPDPGGQHIELGISEMNLFLLLGQLGLAHDHHGESLLPIGTVYDPFVLRGLDAFIYSLYSGSRFLIVGTPSGITLAPEGGAHQSTITPSVGVGLPGVTFSEPAYAQALDWLLCDGLRRLNKPDGDCHYMRLSTRPIDQGAHLAAIEKYGSEVLRAQVIAGGYRLIDASEEISSGMPGINIFFSGAVAPEVLEARTELHHEGVAANVFDVTSLDRLHRSWQSQHRVDDGVHVREPSRLYQLVSPSERSFPVVTVHDAASHSMAWIGSAFGTHSISLGVDRFGESGTIADLYDIFGLTAGDIVNAALIGLDDRGKPPRPV